MTQRTNSKTRYKTVPAPRSFSSGERLGFDAATRLLRGTETHPRILGQVKELGHQPHTWGSKPSLMALCNSITAAEDWLENQQQSPRRETERLRLQDVRRRLEAQLWP